MRKWFTRLRHTWANRAVLTVTRRGLEGKTVVVVDFRLPNGKSQLNHIVPAYLQLNVGDLVVLSGEPFKGATKWERIYGDYDDFGDRVGPGIVMCAAKRHELLGSRNARELYFKIIK